MMSDQLVGEKILTPKAVGSTRDAGKEAEAEAAPAPAPPQQMFVTMNAKMYSLEKFQEDFRDVTVKEVDLLNGLEVSKLYHCDGLVLCVAKDKDEEPKLVLLAQPQDPEVCVDKWFEIYEIKSNSWRVLDVVQNNTKWAMGLNQRGVPVKGNTYFFAERSVPDYIYGGSKGEIFLLCFDFTKERFGPRLPLPFNDSFNGYNGDIVTLSTFLRGDDEQLAVLFGGYESGFFEIWVTLTVDPNGASWSKFCRVDPGPFCQYGFKLCTPSCGGSFFVDEENKVVVLFELFLLSSTKPLHKAIVFGQDGSFKSSVNLGEALIFENRNPFTNNIRKAARPPLVCSSPYRPSLVQVDQPLVHKRKRMSSICYSEIKYLRQRQDYTLLSMYPRKKTKVLALNQEYGSSSTTTPRYRFGIAELLKKLIAIPNANGCSEMPTGVNEWCFREKIVSNEQSSTRQCRHLVLETLLNLDLKTSVNVQLKSHTVDEIREAVRKDNKQRFSLAEENGELLIRANQGHSITTVESEKLLKPILSHEEAPVCVHETYRKKFVIDFSIWLEAYE
ncbi:hypothetical protein Bca4012_057717 [Brassica carinata]